MKKIAFCLMGTCFSLAFMPQSSIAQTNDNSITASSVVDQKTNETTESKVKVLEARLYEIKEMDKSNMTFSDKKKLRKEVGSIKQQLKDMGSGVYISLGALIIIILLLIIIF